MRWWASPASSWKSLPVTWPSATLLGCQGIDQFRLELPQALDAGVTPVMAKEIVYQAVDYLGHRPGSSLPGCHQRHPAGQGAKLPLEDRLPPPWKTVWKGAPKPRWRFSGDSMKDAWKQGHINRWLAANCFGDYYTRTGLDLKQRGDDHLLFLAGSGRLRTPADKSRQGQYEPWQRQGIPDPGGLPMPALYRLSPSLNAISCVNKAAEEMGR